MKFDLLNFHNQTILTKAIMNSNTFKRYLLLVAIGAISSGSHSQDIPNKSITMIVGFAAGGASDTAARLIAKKLSENLDRSVVVDNKPGAGGNLSLIHI